MQFEIIYIDFQITCNPTHQVARHQSLVLLHDKLEYSLFMSLLCTYVINYLWQYIIYERSLEYVVTRYLMSILSYFYYQYLINVLGCI